MFKRKQTGAIQLITGGIYFIKDSATVTTFVVDATLDGITTNINVDTCHALGMAYVGLSEGQGSSVSGDGCAKAGSAYSFRYTFTKM